MASSGGRIRKLKYNLAPATLRPFCMVCCSGVQYKWIPSDAVVLSLECQFEIFCYYMKLTASEDKRFDFFKEPFPFCQDCKKRLDDIQELHEQMMEIQKLINVAVSTLSSKVIESFADTKNVHFVKKPSVMEDENSFVVSESTIKKIEGLRQDVYNQYAPSLQLWKSATHWKRKKPCPKRFKSNQEGVQQVENTIYIATNENMHHSNPNIQVHQVLEIQEITISGSGPNSEMHEAPTFDFIQSMDEGDHHEDGSPVVYELIVPNDGDQLVMHDGTTEEIHVFGDEILEGMEISVGEEIVYQESQNHWNAVRAKKRLPNASLNRSIEIEPNKFMYGNKYPFEKLETGIFKCGTCDFERDTKSKLMRHISLKHCFAGRYECEVCHKTFPTEDYLSKHKLIHPESSPGPVVCEKCGRKFNSKKHMMYRHKCPHREQTAEQKKYQCELCDATFRYDSLLQDHMKCHLNPMYKCSICGKILPSNEELTKHKIVHIKLNPFLCDYCTESFNSKLLLQGHVIQNHKGHGRKHKKDLEQAASEERPFQCSICLASFKKANSLTMHFRCVHGEERPFQCDKCPAKFKGKSTLRCHIKNIHEKREVPNSTTPVERPFKCDKCTRTFTKKKNLTEHMITHSDIKPFGCDLCGYKCRKGSNLKSHVKFVHRGLRRKAPVSAESSMNEITFESFKQSTLPTETDSADNGSSALDDAEESSSSEPKEIKAMVTSKRPSRKPEIKSENEDATAAQELLQAMEIPISEEILVNNNDQ